MSSDLSFVTGDVEHFFVTADFEKAYLAALSALGAEIADGTEQKCEEKEGHDSGPNDSWMVHFFVFLDFGCKIIGIDFCGIASSMNKNDSGY